MLNHQLIKQLITHAGVLKNQSIIFASKFKRNQLIGSIFFCLNDLEGNNKFLFWVIIPHIHQWAIIRRLVIAH